MDGGGLSGAERRVWAALPAGTRAALAGLPAADLRTLLLTVARDRAATVQPADVLRRWREDRFVRPSDVDPRALARVEARLWELLPADVAGVELSPVAPLGTCTAVAPVSQHRIVTTMRGTEVVSDPTNTLAVEAAVRRRRGDEVHLAAVHRVLRAQDFGPGTSAHFRLFTLVSSARDAGSGRTEARLLVRHLAWWHRVLADLAASAWPRLHVTVLDRVVGERLADTVRPALTAEGITVHDEPERQRGRGYYTGAAVRLTLHAGSLEIGDGGGTDWTARLLGDAKERCLVSCLATERLVTGVNG
ncbi:MULTISPECIES: hypothetical protein [Micromonospora]|uniref:Uncharacterized protein n=1 Tax=Micromonospora solifontis TaxID=2487138 RepID=A0ABX9WJJ9_9ACTN|nr:MULTISPECIES: hypothetical protein [Micromonospora]NES15441.1 hypothetical protein [Micromonospora sp. PPF5-17B]NES35813.1 hypothetical protein [Micromonospora solifontis]NES58035.1 hypothetical protein [Micromonospora sp. PPF5-6]RNM00338.1 hypothetical protein EFE23_06485 [Micromonospora solifontis]